MQEYTCGFVIDRGSSAVLLVRKSKPDWQAGKLNGVGGKLERHESVISGMEREWAEESGDLAMLQWEPFCRLNFPNEVVHFLRATNHVISGQICNDVNDVGEELAWYPFRHPDLRCLTQRDDIIPNLRWILPLAFEDSRVKTAVVEMNHE